MTFISWLVFGVLFISGEIATGTYYLLAVGLAFVYPAIAAYIDASTVMQLAVLGSGTIVHVLVVMLLRKRGPSDTSSKVADDVGQRVEVIEWIDESSARVNYRGRVWEADKVRADMPDASQGIIKSVQGSRLIITTEQSALQSA
jgi:membrane protein implicated in regulation of membrane protease activity